MNWFGKQFFNLFIFYKTSLFLSLVIISDYATLPMVFYIYI